MLPGDRHLFGCRSSVEASGGPEDREDIKQSWSQGVMESNGITGHERIKRVFSNNLRTAFVRVPDEQGESHACQAGRRWTHPRATTIPHVIVTSMKQNMSVL